MLTTTDVGNVTQAQGVSDLMGAEDEEMIVYSSYGANHMHI